jgi:transposase-like protein
MKGKPTPPEVKSHILKSFIEDGVPVAELAKEYNLNPNTIYNWIKNSSISNNEDCDKQQLLLKVARLKREKQELIDLIGRLTINVDALNKKKINCFEIAKLPKSHKLALARVCIRDYPSTNKTILINILKLNRSTLYVPQFKDELDKHNKLRRLKIFLHLIPFMATGG